MNRMIAVALCLIAPVLFASGQQGAGAQSAEDYDPEARLAELGITLPAPPEPVANYVNGDGRADIVAGNFGSANVVYYQTARQD